MASQIVPLQTSSFAGTRTSVNPFDDSYQQDTFVIGDSSDDESEYDDASSTISKNASTGNIQESLSIL